MNHTMLTWTLTIVVALRIALPSQADIVVNEIMYHAPEDLDELQFVELHNNSDKTIRLDGWQMRKDVTCTFKDGALVPPGGFFVVCRDAIVFERCYGRPADAVFAGAFKRNGGNVELVNASGQIVDQLKFKSRSPWPVAADGCSASLERICPTAPSQRTDNWQASPMSKGPPKPGGTPGQKNSVYSPQLPPVIDNLAINPEVVRPDQAITVTATIPQPVDRVELVYSVIGTNSESDDAILLMSKLATGEYSAVIPGQTNDRIVRFFVRARTGDYERCFPHPNEIRPRLSVLVHEPMSPGKIPWGKVIHVGKREYRTSQQRMGFRYGPPNPPVPERGNSAFVWVDAKTEAATLFDYVVIAPRNGGCKVHFHKDRPLNGMSTINLVHEGNDRLLVAEPLAFEVYRKAGNAASRTDFVRLWFDGKPAGYHLLIEQPNRSFLRNNKIPTDGDLYKCVWFGRSLVGQHEKKTNPHTGHDDLKKIVELLNKTQGAEQWAIIKKHFDVEQVINYFAVNMVLSHWDGYFNNYFAYYDAKHSGKWSMYPWDQDKTWGFHDGIGEDEVFTTMPITFGMFNDRPPGHPADQPPPPFLTRNAVWWRPGGYFSKPLLANPTFRGLFLARTKEIIETVYTESEFHPKIDALGDRLLDEVRIRAALHGENPDHAVAQLGKNLQLLKDHLRKRRAFLLEQEEIKSASKFDRDLLK